MEVDSLRFGSWAIFWLLLFVSSGGLSVKKPAPSRLAVDFILDVTMPGKQPSKDEEYVCTSVNVPRDGYAIGFHPTAHGNRVHHMLLFACSEPAKKETFWNCSYEICKNSSARILYAWARNAPPLILPENVGSRIGQNQYLVLQIHYGTTFHAHYMNMSCVYDGSIDIHPFAFRTHTHSLGRVVSAGVWRGGKWILIGKRNPQWPQIFQYIKEPMVIHSRDVLAAQCRYNSTQLYHKVDVGAYGVNEMCNFYMMYYYDSKHDNPLGDNFAVCSGEGNRTWTIFNRYQYPKNFSSLLPKKAELEHRGRLSGIKFGKISKFLSSGLIARNKRQVRGGGDWSEAFPRRKNGPGFGMSQQYPFSRPDQSRDGWSENQGYYNGQDFNNDRSFAVDPSQVRTSSRKKPGHSLASSRWSSGRNRPYENREPAKSISVRLTNENSPPSRQPVPPGSVFETGKWMSSGNIKFGQISGLSFDPYGNLVVFHRGHIVWGPRSFNTANKLVEKKPVSVDPVFTIDSKSGALLSSWGANSFYIPHGITVDSKGNVWLTDVGLHQVLKYIPDGKHMKQERVWGERFVPGEGPDHFCKPTAVAVLKDGSFFVADGYCNNRIVHFGPNGDFVKEFGKRTESSAALLGTFILPHDIGVHEEMHHVHVADRENGRLQCLFFNGTPAFDVRLPEDFITVYSIDYNVQTDTFFLMPGEKPREKPNVIKAFSASPKTHLPIYSWAPKNGSFVQPHVIRVSKDGTMVFIGEIRGNGGVLWKFHVQAVRKGKQNKAQEKDDDNQNRVAVGKPDESVDELSPATQNRYRLFLILILAMVVPVLLIALVCACLRFKKQGGFRAANMLSQSSFRDSKFGRNGLNGAFRSHKGFQPLRTEDIDAVDDLTEDESDNEDTLFSAPHRAAPLNT